MSDNIITLNNELIHTELKDLVRNSVEETLNSLLDAEADRLVNADRYARDEERQGYRSGHYDRNFTTTSGDVKLKVPKLKGCLFHNRITKSCKAKLAKVASPFWRMLQLYKQITQGNHMLIIRTAIPQDAPELLAIYAPYVENTAVSFEYTVPSVEEFRARIEGKLPEYPYLVAECDGKAVGYAYAGSFHSREAYKHSVETSIYVKQGMHGKGIGAALYAELEKRLLAQNVYILYACITYTERGEDENLTRGSILFHEKMGYHLIGSHKECGYKFDRWYGIMWYEKLIAPRPEHPEPFIPARLVRNITV